MQDSSLCRQATRVGVTRPLWCVFANSISLLVNRNRLKTADINAKRALIETRRPLVHRETAPGCSPDAHIAPQRCIRTPVIQRGAVSGSHCAESNTHAAFDEASVCENNGSCNGYELDWLRLLSLGQRR